MVCVVPLYHNPYYSVWTLAHLATPYFRCLLVLFFLLFSPVFSSFCSGGLISPFLLLVAFPEAVPCETSPKIRVFDFSSSLFFFCFLLAADSYACWKTSPKPCPSRAFLPPGAVFVRSCASNASHLKAPLCHGLLRTSQFDITEGFDLKERSGRANPLGILTSACLLVPSNG